MEGSRGWAGGWGGSGRLVRRAGSDYTQALGLFICLFVFVLFLTECLLPAVYHEMEMAENRQPRWTILGFICDWPNCCHADLLAYKSP